MGALQIDTLGTSFAIQAQEDSQYLENLLSYFNKITEQVKKNTGLQDPLKCSILSGLMLCDELYREKKANSENAKKPAGNQIPTEELSEAERITLRMISKIDNVL
ncbi:MAG: cell division protein ZapA [Treponema sp.]|nr:cell division protein ZapA [Candidatus Treponema caballi]